jgi:hypothetical protein
MRRGLVLCAALSFGCGATARSSSDAEVDAATDAGGTPDAATHDAATHDAATHDAAVVDASDSGEGAPLVYAVKTVVDVWWASELDPPMIDPGRGFITLFHRLRVDDACFDGIVAQAELEPCGVTFPPYTSWAHCAAYQLEAPASVWSPPPPVWNADDVLEYDDRPSVPLELGNIDQTYRPDGCGINGESPVKFWGLPTSSNVTALCEPTSGGAGGCPVAVDLVANVEALLGQWSDVCTSDESRISTGLAVNGFALGLDGCDLMDGVPCSAEQLEFVEDTTLPTYSVLAASATPPLSVFASPCDCPSGCAGEACPLDQTPSVGTRSAIVPLGEGGADFDCAAVRDVVEATYPGTAF